MQAWFQEHPELHYHPGALGGFDSSYGICRYSADGADKQYRYYVTSDESLSAPHSTEEGLFLGAQIESQRIPIKPNQEKVCRILQDLFPNAQVLIITRGFKGIVQSGYSQLVRIGGLSHPSELCARMSESDDSSQYYDYDFLIDLYSRAFGADSVIVLPFELLRDDQSAFMLALEERLGLTHAELEISRQNPSLSPTELYWYPVLSRRVYALANRLGRRAHKIYPWYVRGSYVNRWHRVIKVLDRIFPGRKITSADFTWEMLSQYKGKAESLRGNPLYEPYAADYLLE